MYESFTLKICDSIDSSWDQQLLLGKTESLYLYHSTHWAARLTELLNYKPLYFSVYEGNKLRLMLLGFIEPFSIFGINKGRKLMIKKIAKLSFGYGNFFWYGQPIYFEECSGSEYSFLTHKLNEFIKKEKFYLSCGEWPLSKVSFLPRGWCKKLWTTFKVDLTGSLDIVFKSFKAAARKEINKAARNGIIVKKIHDLEGLKTYYNFAVECAKRYNKRSWGFEDYSTMWKHLRGWGYFETFVAMHNNKMMAGLSVWGDKYNLMEIGSFQSEECFTSKLGCCDALKWEAIQWAKSVNCVSFDLAGVNPLPKTKKEKGIRQFKAKWSNSEYKYLMLSS